MNQIIIIGTGGHSAELDDYITLAKINNPSFPWEILGYLDDNPQGYEKYRFTAPYLGGIREHVVRKDCMYMMGIAMLEHRRPIIERFLAEGAEFATFIHPTATVSPSAKIGKGVVLALHVNVGPNVVVDDYTLVNSRCSLGHNTQLGKYNFISPNVCFSGFSKVGDENLFGINSATIPHIQIGNRNLIMAGMIIDKNVGDDQTVFYRFKEKVLAIPK
jgi:sugar O-acyltransferase (sialic acid O-acetyltransferase NeuD family)